MRTERTKRSDLEFALARLSKAMKLVSGFLELDSIRPAYRRLYRVECAGRTPFGSRRRTAREMLEFLRSLEEAVWFIAALPQWGQTFEEDVTRAN